MDIKWETPPAINREGRRASGETELANELRNHPDQWARFRDFEDDDQPKAGQLAQLIRSGKRAAFRTNGPTDDGEFEAISRKIQGSNVTAVYVRYATLQND